MKKANIGQWMVGRPICRNAIEAMRQVNTGRRKSPETIARMKEAKRQWWAQQTPERRSEIGKAIRNSLKKK